MNIRTQSNRRRFAVDKRMRRRLPELLTPAQHKKLLSEPNLEMIDTRPSPRKATSKQPHQQAARQISGVAYDDGRATENACAYLARGEETYSLPVCYSLAAFESDL